MNNQHNLVPFPSFKHPDVQVQIDYAINNDILCLNYFVSGDIENIQWPDFDCIQEGNDLWKTTCLECFCLLEDGKSYIELNFSPKGYWHIYYFDDYRQPSQTLKNVVCISDLVINKKDDGCRLQVEVHLNGISIKDIGFTAVIEDSNKEISYWALQHASNNPDFHKSETFTNSINKKL